MHRSRPLALLLIGCLLAPAFGCATVLRSNNRDLEVIGPADLQVTHEGRAVALRRVGKQDDRFRFEGQVPKSTLGVSVSGGGAGPVPVELTTTTSVGWVVLDILFIILLWPIVIDALTSNWDDFRPLDASPALAAAKSRAQYETQPVPVQTRASPPPAPVLVAAPAANAPILEKGKLAVLDLKNFAADLKPEDVRYFGDIVRGAVLKSAPKLDVLTRENLLVLLQASGKDLNNCEGECEVDTGRRIGADAVISGDILKVGTRYKLSLKLHETAGGRLLSTSVGSGKTIDELDESAQAAATELLIPKR